MITILDCTLRDGGYYTNWDFDSNIVDSYIKAMNELPIDYLELGYRNKPQKEYQGKFGYCPVSVLKHIRANSNKKLAVMLNEKSTLPEDLYLLVKPLVGLVDMVRLAVDPKNLDRAIVLAKEVKALGFEVAFNMMYMSKWKQYDGLLDNLCKMNEIIDIFNMVDSYGGITPREVSEITGIVKSKVSCKVGFHGHNNLQLGLINTITAIECGVDSVDATILGMGRGAGNLNTELLLTFLNKHYGLAVDFNELGDAITAFSPLMERYRWGTSLPYMLSGANSFPQKDVMDWVSNRVYSFNSIVRALDNRVDKKEDNAKFPLLDAGKKYRQVLVVGGGNSVFEHIDAIREYISKTTDTAIVFSTARQAKVFIGINADKYYCLVGNEGHRLIANVGEDNYSDKCILPPYPRTMGTEVPSFATNSTFELKSITYIKEFVDSVTTVALQLAMELTDGEIFLLGYDGYPGSVLSEKEVALTNENKTIFQAFLAARGSKLKSLTPSLYKDIEVESVYQFI